MLINGENAAPIESAKEQEIDEKDNKNAKLSSDVGGKSTLEEMCTGSDSGNSKDKYAHFDPEVVQIKAKKAEIDRRISAFIERKRAEIDENNVREFCNVIDCNQGVMDQHLSCPSSAGVACLLLLAVPEETIGVAPLALEASLSLIKQQLSRNPDPRRVTAAVGSESLIVFVGVTASAEGGLAVESGGILFPIEISGVFELEYSQEG
ncbi:MAP3K12-binding inhibitory protein 1 isoform X2 [Microcaecilia unicolor]|uniref:MAP3K12-binding inhibitory protein 1 isoform X2 n=1 Tax=Microcaecilia unicolor TaxID=1415580 RepID=A0A6P7Z557_9AMPH|nr:MAP3K12-binding inhibitory protein 1 isoform X2 [Microcaecilia unicolor]